MNDPGQRVSRPGLEPGPGPSEGPMLSATPPGHKSRRLDSHQHDPVYRTGALLSRATSASISSSTPWGSRTQTQPGFVVPAPVHWTGHGVRVRRAPSGLGGARIHVSGSSGRRYTISATNPTKKPGAVCDTGFRGFPTESGRVSQTQASHTLRVRCLTSKPRIAALFGNETRPDD